jgi:integrase
VREKLDALKRQLADGSFSDTRLTLAEYFTQWLAHKTRTLKPRSVEFYQERFTRYLEPRLGRQRLDRLTPLAIQAALNDLATTFSPDAANKARTTLHAALRQAVKWQLLPRNPVEATDKMKVAPKQYPLWTPAQAAHFLDVAAGHRLFAAFYLLLFTGVRAGELLGLDWDDLQGDMLYIRRSVSTAGSKVLVSTPKTTKSERVVALAADVLEVLKRHRWQQAAELADMVKKGTLAHGSNAMFSTQDGMRLTHSALFHVWADLQQQAGLPHIRLHDLRHLHVSLLVARGLDPRAIADRVGHATAAFTMTRYAHAFAERRKAAALGRSDLLN